MFNILCKNWGDTPANRLLLLQQPGLLKHEDGSLRVYATFQEACDACLILSNSMNSDTLSHLAKEFSYTPKAAE